MQQIKEAAHLKNGAGPELEAQQYKMTSALSLAKTLKTKLLQGMEDIQKEKQDRIGEVAKVDEVANTLQERKRMLERSANLDSVEEVS